MIQGNRAALAVGVALAALLASCGDDKGDTPKGQVVATVNDEDVTVHELNGEVQTLPNRGAGAPRKLVESVALARVVERKMLADVARERNLDKNPQFILQQRRLQEGLLVQALQSDIATKVQPPTRADAQIYIEKNPALFRDRKIFTIDQIQFLRPANIAQLGFAEAKTMGEVDRILIDNGIEYRRQPASVDALAVNPKLTAEINRITANNPAEVFMFADQPQGAPAPIMFVNQVTQTQTKPFTGERAIQYATQLLQREGVQRSLQTQLKVFQDAAKDKITYAAGYGPPPKPGSPEAKAMIAEARKTAEANARNAGRPAPAGTPATAPAAPVAAPVAAPAAG